MKVYMIDAYDSFIYIIYQYIRSLGLEVCVVRNDKFNHEDIIDYAPDFLLLGPGPGHPCDAHYVDIIRRFAGSLPILGVCLGHQAFGLAFGAKIANATHIMHGKTSMIKHDGQACFAGVPNPMIATRYHSLIVEESTIPDCLVVTARSNDDGYIMGLRHKEYPIETIQFHPESIKTQNGRQIFENFIKSYVHSSPNSLSNL